MAACDYFRFVQSKINDVNAPFLDETQSNPNTAGNDTTTKKVARDILDAHPWLATFNDVTGRNMTHKAVIFGQHNLLSLILDRDVDGEARQSRDTVSTGSLICTCNYMYSSYQKHFFAITFAIYAMQVQSRKKQRQ